MSYFVISIILSILVGFVGMLFLVVFNAPADNPFKVVWGSLAFWGLTALLAWLTVGWPSALATITSGLILLALAGRPGDVTFTWGRALVRMANALPLGPLVWPLRFLGVRLQNLQVPLNRPFRR